MRIAIRVDASHIIGTGHVRRMVALARAFADKGADAGFLWRRLGLDLHAMLPSEARHLPVLSAPGKQSRRAGGGVHGGWGGVSEAIDAAETVEHLADFAPDWVVIDHYAYARAWHDAVRAGTGARILVIDDLADRPLAGDLIVDQNYHPDHGRKFAAANVHGARLLAGPAYAMLDPVYVDQPRYRFRPDVRSIGIFMGGIDAPNMSDLALRAIDRAGLSCPVEIATTHANPNLAALHRAAVARPGTRITMDLPNLAGFFARHDLQIGAGGGALWERCCIGAPTLAVIAAENQRESVPWLAGIGALRMADGLLPAAEATDAIAGALAELAADPEQRHRMAEIGQAMVDGLGTRRIADALSEFHERDGP